MHGITRKSFRKLTCKCDRVRTCPGDVYECTHTNVNESNMGPGLGPQVQRSMDGCYTSSWPRKLLPDAADNYAVGILPGCLVCR